MGGAVDDAEPLGFVLFRVFDFVFALALAQCIYGEILLKRSIFFRLLSLILVVFILQTPDSEAAKKRLKARDVADQCAINIGLLYEFFKHHRIEQYIARMRRMHKFDQFGEMEYRKFRKLRNGLLGQIQNSPPFLTKKTDRFKERWRMLQRQGFKGDIAKICGKV